MKKPGWLKDAIAKPNGYYSPKGELLKRKALTEEEINAWNGTKAAPAPAPEFVPEPVEEVAEEVETDLPEETEEEQVEAADLVDEFKPKPGAKIVDMFKARK